MDLKKLIKTSAAARPDPAERLHILFATSEVAPFSKTGGLGDVASSLPKALAKLGHRVNIVTPLYGHLDPEKLAWIIETRRFASAELGFDVGEAYTQYTELQRDTLALVEVMKTFNQIVYDDPEGPDEAKVVEVRAEAAAEVAAGDVLVELE